MGNWLVLIVIGVAGIFVILLLQGITRREVLKYKHLGFDNADIAKRLSLPISAIEWHLQKVDKLGKDGEL